jgi:tRNA G37 N-methylase TrmD
MDTKKPYTIEKNVPLPDDFGGVGNRRIGRWTSLAQKMSVGDSVLVKSYAAAMSLRNALIRVKGKGYSTTVRKEQGGRRLWLVKPDTKNAAK